MNTKYRIFDYSTNMILSNKVLTCQYKPTSRTRRLPSQKSLVRKNQPALNCQIFQNKNKNDKILSKSDREDLFLEGGNFIKIRRRNEPTQRQFWMKTNYGKKLKPEIFIKNNFNKELSTSFFDKDVKLEDNAVRYKTMNKTRVFSKGENRVVYISKPDSKVRFDNFPEKKSLIKKVSQNTDSNKNLALTTSSTLPKNKPLFYLEQKQLTNISAQSFIVTQYPSGQLIAGNYYKKTGQIASLTKIMTFYCVYKVCLDLSKDFDNQIIQIDDFIETTTGTSAELWEGDTYKVKQLLYGLMLPSGNDAATALAKWAGKLLSPQEDKPVKSFVNFMNQCSKELNMKMSKFSNPHGLPNSAATSNSEDIAILIHQCLKIQLFKQVVSCKQFKCITTNLGVKREVIWENTNKLLRRNGFMGVKTGVTVTAGPCLASCYETNNKIFIVVLLRTKKLSRRFKETRIILGTILNKIDSILYRKQVNSVLREDRELDSDNSDDQQQFCYDRKDAAEMAKRNKILKYEM